VPPSQILAGAAWWDQDKSRNCYKQQVVPPFLRFVRKSGLPSQEVTFVHGPTSSFRNLGIGNLGQETGIKLGRIWSNSVKYRRLWKV